MKKIYFECENCNEKSEPQREKAGFPYAKGWVYAYNVELKLWLSLSVNSPTQLKLKDKHFCSGNCLLEYLKTRLKTDV